MSDYEEDFMKYREELAVNIFANIASIKQFNQVVLQMIVELLQGINPASSTFQQAELVLYLIYNLQ